MKRKLMLFLTCLFISVGLAIAQTQTITGTVISDEDGQPVVGASVLVKGTTIGAITDIDGNFTLSNVPSSAKTLQISFIGMLTQDVPVKNNVKIALRADNEMLDEVIVVAYGTAKKESFTGSAAVIDNKKLEKRTVSNISKALDGQSPGVIATSGSGQPGDGASVVIRGMGSINASNTPLYVIDGIPFDGTLSSISPSDIESMTILKDASAGALYGARGANGVIIITTKKGKEGKTRVNYKSTVGWSSRGIKEYDMVNQKDFTQLTYEALRNRYVFNNNYEWEAAESQARKDLGGSLGGEQYNPFKGKYSWAEIIDPATGQVRADATSLWNESWMDEITNNNALRHEHQVSFTGGTEKTKAMFSLGYLNEDGVLEITQFQRYNARINVDTEVNDWVKGGLNVALSHSISNYQQFTGSTNSNVWYSAQFMAPIYPVYLKDANGVDALDEFGNKQLDYGTGRPKLSNFSSIGSLRDDLSDVKNDNASVRLNFVVGSDKDTAGWAKGLKLTFNFGSDYRSSSQMNYYNPFHGNQAIAGGLIYKLNGKTLSYTMNQLLTWNKSLGDHNIDLLAGHEYYNYEYSYLEASKTGLVPYIYELRPGTTLNSADSYTSKYRIQSLLSRANYNYKEKYYFSASLRSDGSSRFYKDNRWGTFWSVGANWRVSQEAFMEGISWIDNLSVKASYGVQGNDALLSGSANNFYAWQGLYALDWNNANSIGAVASTLENKNVSWEKNGNFNIGFDVRLFKGKLDVTFEYFNRKTTDLLLNNPMALSTGFTGYSDNIGSMKNQGIEFTVGSTIVDTKNVTWRATFMGTHMSNKVLKLSAQVPEIVSGVRVIKEGYPIYTFYMAKSAGVDPATGAQLYWVYDKDSDGNITNERMSSDYAKAATSKYYLGSRLADFQGSFGSEFNFFKSFDLSFLTTFSIGGKTYDSLYAGAMNPMYSGDTFNKHALRRWQQPGDITDVPRVEIGGNYTTTDRFLIDASYFAIKNITLGYTLPSRLCKRIGLESLRVFGVLDNLATFSHLQGMNPQYSFTGSTDYVYNPNKTYSLGLEINF